MCMYSNISYVRTTLTHGMTGYIWLLWSESVAATRGALQKKVFTKFTGKHLLQNTSGRLLTLNQIITIFYAWFLHSLNNHGIIDSLEIWAVKLQFLLIYENMLKSVATARSECTAKTRKQGELQHRLHCSWFGWHFWQWLKKYQNIDWKKKYLYL